MTADRLTEIAPQEFAAAAVVRRHRVHRLGERLVLRAAVVERRGALAQAARSRSPARRS